MRRQRFEIVRTGAGHHARFIATNGRTVWSTEVYTARGTALNGILVIAKTFWAAAVLTPTGNAVKVDRADSFGIEIRDVDERYVPPPVELQPPFWRREIRPLIREGRRMREGDPETFWHDQEYHYRQCWGDECTEETPPVGTMVRSRMGEAKYTGTES